ncbi:hypothetical protein DFS34DRAFT_691439 [Phlyctochytrium arcticum]|nr:hypothetical protein DFS34DRAFT_691439 [Phlyctochytrium arcticum]
MRVVDDNRSKRKILKEFHASVWAGHRGIYATFTTIQTRYWWLKLYNSIVEELKADHGELDANEPKVFFQRYGLQTKLTLSYNPEGNGKYERGHRPIIKSLATFSTVTTGYTPTELMLTNQPIHPTEEAIETWWLLPWKDGISTEELLALRIQQISQRESLVHDVQEKLKARRLKSNDYFDKTHRIQPIPVEEGDWV